MDKTKLAMKKWMLSILVLILATFVALAGCTGSSSNSQPSASPSGNPADTGSQVSGQQDGTPKRGGTFRIGIPFDAATLGYAPDMRFAQDFFMANPAVETLGVFDENANMRPHLAESWESDPDAKTVTIKLKPGIKFHDGTDFNAEAVKWNIDNFIAAKRAELSGLASVDVVDSLTVRLNLSEWNSSLLEAVCTFVYITSPTAFEKNGGKEWAAKNPVGTGPFQFVSWEKDVGVKYKRFDQYWQEGQPYLDAIEFVVIPDQTSGSAAFRNGEVDAYVMMDPQIVSQLEGAGVIKLLKTGQGASGTGLIFNSKDPNSPFHDVRVRQAVAHAIDIPSILKPIFKDYVIETHQWGVPGIWAQDPNFKGFEYNPEKAKQLLAEAGYPNGFKTKITIRTTEMVEMFTAVQAQLAQIGIQADVEPVDLAKFQDMTGKGTWDGMIQYNYRGDADISTYMPRNFGSGGVLYAPNLDIPAELDQKFAEIKAARDQETRTKIAHELQRLVYEKYTLAIPMFVGTSPAILSPKVHGDGINVGYGSVWTPGSTWKE